MCSAGGVSAQGATGKVEGRVQDGTGAPIVEAQVHLVGGASIDIKVIVVQK